MNGHPAAHSFRHAFLLGDSNKCCFLLLFVFRSQVRSQPMEQAFAGFDGSVPECTLVGLTPASIPGKADVTLPRIICRKRQTVAAGAVLSSSKRLPEGKIFQKQIAAGTKKRLGRTDKRLSRGCMSPCLHGDRGKLNTHSSA